MLLGVGSGLRGIGGRLPRRLLRPSWADAARRGAPSRGAARQGLRGSLGAPEEGKG
ncbi:COL11A1: Collagen alpha-1 [Crotalus adamanteus]|uniref:COL11A1: Collagen alpha-1 n=1 Tax=Crotalus adamanteus TaxID=8729 RepID=A0AAW1C4D7_CROAD